MTDTGVCTTNSMTGGDNLVASLKASLKLRNDYIIMLGEKKTFVVVTFFS